MNRFTLLTAGLVLGAAGLTGCDYDGDFLFAQPTETVPGILDLGTLEPSTIETLQDVRNNTHYGEVGVTGTAQLGGMSFTFAGTGRDVCVFVDPETVGWHQSVSRQSPTAGFTWPDNFLDDGDIDLYAGVSVYYSGSPGFEMGGFEVRYQDDLGNEIPVEFNECTIVAPDYPNGGAHSGRAMPEYCTLRSTQTDVDYTVVLETFSPPADDNRLGYGLLFVDGPCDDVEAIIQTNALNNSECLILGESIDPRHGHDYREEPFLAVGYDNVETYSWDESTTIEQLFCDVYASQTSPDLRTYCEEEDAALESRADCDDEETRCFCGDFEETPPADYD